MQAVRASGASASSHARQAADAWIASGGLFILAVALLVAGLLYLRQASAIATGGYDILQLEAERSRLEIANRQLSYQVAELSSLSRIEAEASGRLKLSQPKDPVFVKAR